MMISKRAWWWAAVCVMGLRGSAQAADCESLADLKLEHTVVKLARVEKAGRFHPPDVKAQDPGADLYRALPAFCRVVVEISPTSDSQIEVEVWLPAPAKWNHKFRGEGNGGFAGQISYRGLAGSVLRGYATAATDTGHKGDGTDASWALNHPEKIVDFGYRGIHEMTEKAKAVIAAYYEQLPRRAYFDSCSDGGREALMEAQRFPGDYDGILAGAPANQWTRGIGSGLALLQKTGQDQKDFVPPERLPLITKAALAQCDAKDGLKDGILNDPRACGFRAASIACKGAAAATCLTAAQAQTVDRYYEGGKLMDGRQIFPGLMPTSEAGEGGWEDWVTGKTFGDSAGVKFVSGFFSYMVYNDPNWNFATADVGKATKEADSKLGDVLNATDPDLGRFASRGGKLILYHGWLDPAISPLNSIAYFENVQAKMGPEKAASFVRLYMVPGMRHCVGGPGPYIFGQLGIGANSAASHNIFASLELWVEEGLAPARIIATKPLDDKDPAKGAKMTRPLCAYPELATYKGRGSRDKAESFECTKETEETSK